MTISLTIAREDLKDKAYKKRVKKVSGNAPDSRDSEALAELLKALKKS